MMHKTVLVSGHFNVIHPGHLRLLRFAKECGTYLTVAVESDRLAGQAAHVRQDLRLDGVQSNSYVDDAFIIDEPVEQVVARLKPDIVIKGKEHEGRANPEADVLKSYGGKLIFGSGEIAFSSLDLLKRESSDIDHAQFNVPKAYIERHRIHKSKLIDLIHSFSRQKILVLGDLIIDEYITCDPLGMSQEDPTIVVSPIDSSRFIGGSGIVAAHAAGFGASVSYISVSGEDEIRTFALDNMREAHVESMLYVDETRPTTLKQRYRSRGRTLFRVSHLHQGAISSGLQQAILERVEQLLPELDLLLFSDFNYGCLPQPMVEAICEMAVQHSIMIVADSQSSSQVGDISRFKGMHLITPTEREARISLRNQEDGLVVMAEKLRQQSSAENILLKLGEEGMLVHASDKAAESGFMTDRLGALNPSPKDVAGAGDSLFIVSSLVLTSGGSIWEAAYLGSMAAAIQVSRVGNVPLQMDELVKELSKGLS